MRSTVHKTYKLYIGGKFPRSESGRTLPLLDPRALQRAKKSGRSARGKAGAAGAGAATLCQLARGSRKDFRNAIECARKAQKGWAAATALLRGQILYRMAEMLDHRRLEFEHGLVKTCGATRAQAQQEVDASADRLLWYAGWCDKLAQALGTVNPVAGPFFNFSMPEPSGVVAIMPPARPALLGLVSTLAPVLVPGNTAVVAVPIEAGAVAIDFAEICATSDVPGGVVNIITGTRDELLEHIATHRDVDGNLLVSSDPDEVELVEREAADHVKRQLTLEDAKLNDWRKQDAQSLDLIRAFCEIKTAWHTMGR